MRLCFYYEIEHHDFLGSGSISIMVTGSGSISIMVTGSGSGFISKINDSDPNVMIGSILPKKRIILLHVFFFLEIKGHLLHTLVQ
jgi:hypothetical protein